MLSVRIVTSDHSMDDPIPGLDVTFSSFRGTVVKKVPVIRIFGPDRAGVKTCLHIHGVFPYIFVPCEESQPDGKIQYQLASSLDLALNISLGQTSSSSQHVFKVVLVSGTPFYGFHPSAHQFYKIFFYNPAMIKKAAELLQSGAILNKVYQVHHCHVPYNLQFFIDYNLRGMDYIIVESVKYRRHPASGVSTTNWANDEYLLPDNIPRLSVSEIEADAMAGDILNVRTMSLDMNPGLVDIWDDEKQRRRGECRSSQITPPSSQQRPVCGPTESEIFFKNRLQENLRLRNAQPQDSSSSSLDYSPNINTSIPYPAEVPAGSSLMNASYLDSHLVSASEIPKNLSPSTNVNESFVDENLVLGLLSGSQKRSQNDSVLLDSQDLLFADVLGELQEDNVRVDDDSILGSQLQKNGGEEDADFLGLDHDLVNTILEKNVQINSARSATKETRQMWQESFWSGVNADSLIPQLDGTLESPDSTPGTSTNEMQPLLDLAPCPNYWPFPELAALEPCDEGTHSVANGSGERNEEDLMDLSYSTATYSNISEPYNRVLLGDPSFTSPPSATPSELGDLVTGSGNEFGNGDPNFDGELLENLNFPDIGDLLEPTLSFAPVKMDPKAYVAELNGSAKKRAMAKERRNSKAIRLSQKLNGSLASPCSEMSPSSDSLDRSCMFQHPQQPAPFTNGGNYLQPFQPNASAESDEFGIVKPLKKAAARRKSISLPPLPENSTFEVDGITHSTPGKKVAAKRKSKLPPVPENAALDGEVVANPTHLKKVSAKRRSVSTQSCTNMLCYEESINNAIIRVLSDSYSENQELVHQYGCCTPDTNVTFSEAPISSRSYQNEFAGPRIDGNLQNVNSSSTSFTEALVSPGSYQNEFVSPRIEGNLPNVNNSSTRFTGALPSGNYGNEFVGAKVEETMPNVNSSSASFTGAPASSGSYQNEFPSSKVEETLPNVNSSSASFIETPVSSGSYCNAFVSQQTVRTLPNASASSTSFAETPISSGSYHDAFVKPKVVGKLPNYTGASPANPTKTLVSPGGHRKICGNPKPRVERRKPNISSSATTGCANSLQNMLHSLPGVSFTLTQKSNSVADQSRSKGTHLHQHSHTQQKSGPPLKLVIKAINNKRPPVVRSEQAISSQGIKNTRPVFTSRGPQNFPVKSLPLPSSVNRAESNAMKIQRNNNRAMPVPQNMKSEEAKSVTDPARVMSPRSAGSSGVVRPWLPVPGMSCETNPTAHKRSPLSSVRREDDLTLAELMKLEKQAKEKLLSGMKHVTPASPKRYQSHIIGKQQIKFPMSETTSLEIVKKTSVILQKGNCLTENIRELEEHSRLTISDEGSGADRSLKFSKNSTNKSVTLDAMLDMVREVYKSPNPMQFTMFKDMGGGAKYRFEVVEVRPHDDVANTVDPLASSKPTLDLRARPERLPTAESRRRAVQPSFGSGSISDEELIALFEARTGQKYNLNAIVWAENLSADMVASILKEKCVSVPKQFKIPCVDGGMDSDLSSSDEESSTSQQRTPKRRKGTKGTYRALAVQFEKSPKSQPSKSSPARNVASPTRVTSRKRKRPKRGSYGALDIKFDKSPQQSQEPMSPTERRPSKRSGASSSFESLCCRDQAVRFL